MKIIGLTLILIIAIAADAITGMSSIVAQTSGPTFEQGTATCTITNHVCVVTVIFPIPFVSVPKRIDVSWGGVNFGINHPDVQTTVGAQYFESDNGTTWHNMPAALTELYGNPNHETTLVFTGGTGTGLGLQAFATCINGSTSVNAVLRPQFEPGGIGSGVWFSLANNPTALDIPIDTNTCFTGLGVGPVPSVSTFAGINSTYLSGEPIRMVGINGAGVGDNPILNEIGLTLNPNYFHTPSICVNTFSQCDGTGQLATKTQFRIQATIAFVPIGSYVINFQWDAYL